MFYWNLQISSKPIKSAKVCCRTKKEETDGTTPMPCRCFQGKLPSQREVKSLSLISPAPFSKKVLLFAMSEKYGY